VLVRVVQEPDTKQSNAEAFIESIKESLKEQSQDEEDTIIAANIEDLQQQVSGIEQQVRPLTRDGRSTASSRWGRISVMTVMDSQNAFAARLQPYIVAALLQVLPRSSCMQQLTCTAIFYVIARLHNCLMLSMTIHTPKLALRIR
jgi:DNA-binding transcriptional MerR regulator